jgi:hypothetical protein
MSARISYEDVNKYYNANNYILLENEYLNYNVKMKTMCPSGHIFSMNYNNFHQGMRCPICRIERLKHPYNFVKLWYKKIGYILRETNYVNGSVKMETECPSGHIFFMTFDSFKRKKEGRCPICAGNQRHSIEFIRGQYEKSGYELLEPKYTNNITKMKTKCDNGHIYYSTYSTFNSGHRCPVCWENQKYSKGEKEIYEYVKQIYSGTVIPNDKTQIIKEKTGNYLELDIWIPELNKAIEYNGEYWHNLKRVRNNDFLKQQRCKELGIDLLVIKEKDWQKNKNFNMIKKWVDNL